MSAFWAVFLLCSLLTPSKGLGIMVSIPQEVVDDPLAKRDLLKLQGRLLGSNLLSGVLEEDSPVGSLLGRSGVLGGLLGKDSAVGSLLGKDSALGSLLGKDSALGSLLGGDGAVGSLLGKDGAVGSLLGKDSALGSLLGGDGAVGSLLGKDGAVGSLLGKDGAVGSLLGKDGAVGSLLGKDSALGSLLGGDGAVGSLLGKDSALGSLLGKDDAVGNLLGKDGAVGSLLGKDSALGSLLGGDGAVGSLLGKDGAVGSLLGKDSALGSLLGGDGAVGSLLGKDGAVGSLLGKDGAVGSLLGKDSALGSLLGGDGAVGSLLGKDGAVGSLLGKDGAVGSLLGKDSALGSLLGKDGAVGSLLGKDGAVGSLLGKDSALRSLLGGDGAVGSLLGKDGAVGSLLGKDGAVGSLLGKDGVVGGLLGGDGAIGSLLGKDGAVGSLLGKDGVVGGLLGGDGVLGALLGRDGALDVLLGKDGLVDSLLDAVLDILIGKGGLLGKDGLVGNLLGGNGGDLTGMKIVNNTLPKVSLRSLPGFGHQVGFNTQLLVESTGVPGRTLCVQVEADATMLVQDKGASLQNNKDCKIFDINIRLRPNVPLLEEPLKRLLSDSLSEGACNIINARLNVVSSLLGSRTPALPLGAVGDLPPFSIISDDAIQLDLNLLDGDVQGGVMASTQGPPLAATLLLATGRPPQLNLPQNALSDLLEMVQAQGAFNFSITNSMVPNSISLSASSLLSFIPQLSRILPHSLPLELRVQVASEPVVAVRGRKATATLKASIDIFSPLLQSSQTPLFSFDTDIVLNIIPTVSDGKLRTSLALDSINLTRAPLRLDPLSLSALTGQLKQVLAAAYVPAINDALSVSVPLPNVLNTSLRNAKVVITDADNSPDTDLKRFCSGGPSTLLTV